MASGMVVSGALTHRPARQAPHRPTHRRSVAGRRAAWAGLAVLATAAAVGVPILDRDRVHAQVAGVTQASHAVTSGDHAAAAVLTGVRSVSCWDGGTASTARECGVPSGRVGMATVFGSLTDTCTAGPAPRQAAEEVWVCHGDGYTVRLTRWRAGFDRFAVLDRAHGSDGAPWTVHGRFAGRTWTSVSPGSAQPDRWSATYRASPLSVDVRAVDPAARAAAVAAVRPVPAGRVGQGRASG